MEIHLSFSNLAELQEFAQWANGRDELSSAVIARDMRGTDTRPVTGEGAVIGDDDHDETPEPAQEPANAASGEPSSSAPVPEPAPKRKRRTKAEIAADKADADALAAQPPPADIAPAPVAPASLEQHAEITALAATIDGADKMAHMNEGREFISKHGFPKYNETFGLVDVPANISAHTPEQGALHRAAMQWLAAQDGAK